MKLLVIADPSAPFIKALQRLPEGITRTISNRAEELAAAAPEADAILYADFESRLLQDVLSQAPRVRWVHSLWTGVEGILSPAMLRHPSSLTNGRGVFRWPLADWVTAAMLFFAFDFRRVIQQQQERVWKPVFGTSLNGRTLGIIGYGSIGTAAAQRARSFGMKVVATRRRLELLKEDPLLHASYSLDQLRTLMGVSDYVLVVTPLTPETKGLIGEAELAAMKATAVIINVGRGPVIDEDALIGALESGRIRGAALDVFTTEPLPADHPFWRMPNVLLSPHTADRVEGFLEPAFDCFFENLERFRSGGTLTNVVDKHAGY